MKFGWIVLMPMMTLAAPLQTPAFRMGEPELLAVLKENSLNDQVTACQELQHRGSAACVPALAAHLTDAAAPALFHAARSALEFNPAPSAGEALKAALAVVKDAKRHAAIESSLRRRATPGTPGYAAAIPALTAFPPRNAVQRGDLAAVPGLVEKALGTGFEAQFARRELVGFPNDGVVAQMLALAKGPDVKRAKLAISVLGDRRVRAVLPALCALARTTPEGGVRTEVFKALVPLCDGRDTAMLVDLLKAMPQEDRLAGAIIRIASREFVADKVDVKVARAEYGYFGTNVVRNAKGSVVAKPYVDVMDMVTSLIAAGSRTIMAGNRLAGHGGFPFDPAPGMKKELHLTYRLGNQPQLSVVIPENEEVTLISCRLPETVAKPLVEGCRTAEGAAQTALMHVLAALEKRGRVPAAESVLFRPIFNGRDLTGWSQQDGYFSVQDGAIVGTSTPEHLCKPNHHLVYTAETLKDFELRAEFRLSRGANSGIQLRCPVQFVGDAGYQADMDGGGNYEGFIYHPRQHLVGERGADVTFDAKGTKTVSRFADRAELGRLYRKEQWNDIRVVVAGRTIAVWINGVRCTSVTDARDEFLPASGHIALQLHQGPPMKVEFRNLRLRK